MWTLQEVSNYVAQASLYHLLLEGLLFMWVLWLLFRKSYNPKEERGLTEEEKEELIREWQPEPLVPKSDPDHRALHPRIVSSRAAKYLDVNGKRCLNLATHNYLNLMDNQDIQKAATQSLHKYGVGSCGPRGFYGTVDVHVALEKQIAKFMKLEEALLYSYGFSTIASAIPAYSKRNDVIFVDSGVNFAIHQGLVASRSRIRYFQHNDMEHLEHLLKEQAEEDLVDPKKAKVTRRFLVIEGIYLNSGDLPPLPRLLELKKEHKIEELDLIMGSLEASLASIGGFCVGSTFVVEHQRLSGLGYCFSASLPPLLAVAASEGLSHIEANPTILSDLMERCNYVHKCFQKGLTLLSVGGHADSPIKHLHLRKGKENREDDIKLLNHIVQQAEDSGLALVIPSYLESQERFLPAPSIRITVNVSLTNQEINGALKTIEEASISAFTQAS